MSEPCPKCVGLRKNHSYGKGDICLLCGHIPDRKNPDRRKQKGRPRKMQNDEPCHAAALANKQPKGKII
jgi:hypothetical protein